MNCIYSQQQQTGAKEVNHWVSPTTHNHWHPLLHGWHWHSHRHRKNRQALENTSMAWTSTCQPTPPYRLKELRPYQGKPLVNKPWSYRPEFFWGEVCDIPESSRKIPPEVNGGCFRYNFGIQIPPKTRWPWKPRVRWEVCWLAKKIWNAAASSVSWPSRSKVVNIKVDHYNKSPLMTFQNRVIPPKHLQGNL